MLVTCHDRRELTLRCLRSLGEQAHFREEDLYLVDDGSADGTGDAVRTACPDANVLKGEGDLFWNGGMRMAWDAAVESGVRYDFFLWLNDDVVLRPDALARLVNNAASATNASGEVIVAGSTVDPDTGHLSYGGQRSHSARRPLRFDLVAPADRPQAAETMSGNIVLVSAAAHARLGNISPLYEHIFGDLDYGLRATGAGMPVVVGAGVFGECEAHRVAGSSHDPSLGRVRRLRLKLGEERRVHARDWRRFVRRFSGLGRWSALYSVTPYLRLLASPVERDARAR